MLRTLRPWSIRLLLVCLALFGARPAAVLATGTEATREAVAVAVEVEVVRPAIAATVVGSPTTAARAALPAPSPRQHWRRANGRRTGRECSATLPVASAPGSNSVATAFICRVGRHREHEVARFALTDQSPTAPRAPPSQS